MNPRNPFLKDIEVYRPLIDDALKSIEEWQRLMRRASEKDRIAAAKAGYFKSKVQLLVLRYSRGDKLTDLKNDLNEVINDFIAAESCYRDDSLHTYTGLIQLFNIQSIITLLAFSVCLSADKKMFFRLLSWLQPVPENSLIDLIVSHFQPDRNFEESEEAIEDKYELLIEAINAPRNSQVRLLEKYLVKQLNVSSEDSADNANAPSGSDTGKSITSDWCFEVALVVKMFGLDDSTLSDIPSYPKDLVYFIAQ